MSSKWAAFKPSHASAAPARNALLQRKCDCGQHTMGACEECGKNRVSLQRPSVEAACFSPRPSEAPPIVHDVLHSPGEPLDAATRAFFEPRFGHDFSGVRVHNEGKAA